ncbi:hypothetical protein B484DRAFT_411509 [Ochromonadaceae sp. CCMP2298]|nr:hypothetical protein B484DRAFT_411509 [Ochromonadaceae sp. CCMP2298]
MLDLKMITAVSGLKDQMLRASEVYKQMRTEQVNAQKDSMPVLEWGSYVTLVEQKYKALDREAVFVKLYDELPIRDNLNAVVITDEAQIVQPVGEQEARNYLLMPKGRKKEAIFILQRFKSINKFDIQRRPVSVKLTKLLAEFITAKKVKVGAYLFGLKGSSEKLGTMISAMSKRIGIPEREGGAGTNYLRHSFASSATTDTAEQRAALSFKMLHSSSTNKDYKRATVRSIADLK